MTQSALLTGATGFVGRRLTERLRESGWSVRGCDVNVAEEREDLLSCDITDSGQIRSLVDWAGEVTHVFHLAAVTFVPDAAKDPVTAFRVNVEGTIRLTQTVFETWPEVRFIFVSTADVYGKPVALPITEDHPVNPANPYAISKAAGDHYCAYIHKATGASIIRVRPFNHSGPGQSPAFVLSDFAKQIAAMEAGQTEPVLHVGALDNKRDFSHVSDVVRAYEALALKGKPGEVYNVCSGKSHAIREGVDMLRELASVEVDVQVEKERLRPVEVAESVGSYAKLQADTGWKPQKTFQELVEDLLEYWRKNIADNGS